MKPHFYRRLFMLLLFLFLAQSLPVGRSPLFAQTSVPDWALASASTPLPPGCGPKQARYKVEVAFPGRIQAIWTLMIDCDELLDNGQTRRHLLRHKSIDVSMNCQAYGDFHIRGDRAHFDGKSAYIHCSLPGMLAELLLLDPDFYSELQECGCSPDSEIWVTGKVALSNQVAAADHANPLLVHDDLRFYMPQNEEGVTFSHLYIQQERDLFMNPGLGFRSQFAQRLQWSTSTANQEGDDTLFWVGDNVSGFHDVADFGGWANFLDTGEYWGMVDYVQANNMSGFVQWVKSVNEKSFLQSPARTSFSVTTGPTTLYLGFDPVNQTYFSGSMIAIGMDPPPCKSK